jgi:hypothetical protein
MSIVLSTGDGASMKINAWNWGVLHYRVARAALFDAAMWEPKRFNAGGDLELDDVRRLADWLEHDLVPMIGDGERMFFDGSVTDVPDDGTFYRDEAEMWKNYSLHHAVLVDVIAFLRAATGPVAVH